MKILLLNPPNRREGGHLLREECAIGSEPLRVLPSQIYIAGSFLTSQGWDVQSVDAGDTTYSLAGFDVVVVWVSVINSYFQDLAVLREAKQRGTRTVMILNDPYDGFEFETMQNNPFIDAAIRLWEREITLHSLLKSWDRDEKPRFPGLILRLGSRLHDTGTDPPQQDLGHLTSSAELLERESLDRYEAVLLTAGRGCPTACPFCLYRGTTHRARRVDDIVSELEIVSTGLEYAIMIDPAMMSNPQWISNLCEEVRQRNLSIEWRADGRPEECRGPLLEKMHRSGCRQILTGVESLEEKLTRELGVGITPEKLEKIFARVQASGIQPYPVFYIGFPWDSPITLKRIREFTKQHPGPFILKQVRPWRGTPLYDAFRALSLLNRIPRIEEYVNSEYPMCDTLHLSKEQLEEWKLRMAREAVFSPHTILDFLKKKKLPTPLQLQMLTRIMLQAKTWRKETLWSQKHQDMP